MSDDVDLFDARSFEDGPPPPVMTMWSPPIRTYPFCGE